MNRITDADPFPKHHAPHMADIAHAVQTEASPHTSIESIEHELSTQFPISPLFALKQSLLILVLIGIMLGLYFFGGPTFTTSVENVRESLGVEKPVLYYSACGMLALSVVYWLLYIKRFRFGLSKGIFYIRKGVFIQSTYDYPLRAIANVAVKRGFFDFLFCISTVELMTAHEESDDLASIRGMWSSSAEDLHRFLREILARK